MRQDNFEESLVPNESSTLFRGKIKTISLRFSMPVVVLLYCVSFQWSYAKWIAPVWGYMGPTYNPPDPVLLFTAYALAVILCILSPLKLRRTSLVIYWFLFFTVYLPGMLAPLFTQLDSSSTLLLLELSLTGGMLVIALSYRARLASIRHYPVSRQLFWVAFLTCFVLSNAALLVTYRHSLHLASIDEVYDVRAQALAVGTQNPAIGYVSSLLSSVMNPFLIAYGLTVRRRKLIVLGILGQVLVYSTAAMKSVLLSPLFIILVYYSVKKDTGAFAAKLGLLCSAMFLGFTALVGSHNEGFVFNLASLSLLRSFAIPGVEIGEYQYFFEHSPHTYLSHVHGVNLLIANPYSMELGREIGYFYEGEKEGGGIANANASFFAMDGIAGFGLPGILIMGVLCAAMFWVLDSCSRGHPLAFTASALTSCTISLTNGSLFTSFLGGGIMLFMLLFIVMPRNFLEEDFRRMKIPSSSASGQLSAASPALERFSR